MKLNAYGKLIEISRQNSQWSVFYLGTEGKKRLATDIHIPSHMPEDKLAEYIADMCHEWATPIHNEVKILS